MKTESRLAAQRQPFKNPLPINSMNPIKDRRPAWSKWMPLLCLFIIPAGLLSAPVLKGPNIVNGWTATEIAFQLTLENADSFTVEGLPEGLVFIPETGIIEGTVVDAGNWQATVKATQSQQVYELPLVLVFRQKVSSEVQLIYYNGNIASVQNHPKNPTRFTLNHPIQLTRIIDYHYFNVGALPGTIALQHEDETTYGPWQTYGTEGQGGVNNAYWNAEPMTILKPGTYTVIDSDPATWSHNYQSDNQGFNWIYGYVVSDPDQTTTANQQVFALWTLAHGLTGADAEPDVDPERDNLPNWAEIARGTDPTEFTSGFLCRPINSVAAAGGISYVQRSGGQGLAGIDYEINGVRIFVEVNERLDNHWRPVKPSSYGLETVVTPLGNGTEQVDLFWSIDTPVSHRFLRVRMEK